MMDNATSQQEPEVKRLKRDEENSSKLQTQF